MSFQFSAGPGFRHFGLSSPPTSINIRHTTMVFRLCLLATYLIEVVLGLSNSFRIVGMAGTGTQLLPENYVRSFARWTVEEQDLQQQQQQQIASLSSHASATRNTRSIRPTLDVLVKAGTPAYVMAGLQVATMQDGSSSSISSTHLAQQWTTFASAADRNFRIVIYKGAGDGTDERVLLIGNDRIRNILENLACILSRPDATRFAEGFHILSFPATTEWIELDTSIDGVLSCMATAESDSRELLSLNKDLLELTITSILQIPLPDLGNTV